MGPLGLKEALPNRDAFITTIANRLRALSSQFVVGDWLRQTIRASNRPSGSPSPAGVGRRD